MGCDVASCLSWLCTEPSLLSIHLGCLPSPTQPAPTALPASAHTGRLPGTMSSDRSLSARKLETLWNNL